VTDAAPKIATFASESGHWYDKDANLIEEVEGKKPDFRNKLVRKYDLAPGITSVMRMKAAPGLTRWMQQEAIRCALTMPRKPEQSEAEWLDAILADSGETARSAADEGTRIHAAIEKWYGGEGKVEFVGPYGKHVAAVASLLASIAPFEQWEPERSIVHPYGYGTKSDLHSSNFVIDFKGTENPVEELNVYDNHWMQLSATREALFGTFSGSRYQPMPAHGEWLEPTAPRPTPRGLIVYVHRTEAWAHAIEVKEEQLTRGWQMFLGCLYLWQQDKKYAPSWGKKLEIA
jgi:hypothetical protein